MSLQWKFGQDVFVTTLCKFLKIKYVERKVIDSFNFCFDIFVVDPDTQKKNPDYLSKLSSN